MLPTSACGFGRIGEFEGYHFGLSKYRQRHMLTRTPVHGRLEKMTCYDLFITPVTFLTIIQSSPKLKWISVEGIITPDSGDRASVAAGIIECISARFKIELEITIFCGDNEKMWKSKEVKAALKKLKEKNGHVIKFK